MSFDTPRGTRGARQPGGKLMAWMNRWNMNRIRGNADAGAIQGVNFQPVEKGSKFGRR